jgi:hypothetical protein
MHPGPSRCTVTNGRSSLGDKGLGHCGYLRSNKGREFGQLVSLDDLLAGIQPFPCGFDAAPVHTSVADSIATFDLMQSGQLLPTEEEAGVSTEGPFSNNDLYIQMARQPAALSVSY